MRRGQATISVGLRGCFLGLPAILKLPLREMVVAQVESNSIGPVSHVKFRRSHIYAKLSLASDKPITPGT
jgi:hypothetical protein